MSEVRAHRLARCCWCGSSFIWAAVKGARAWICPTEACWARQLGHHVSVSLRGQRDVCVWVPLPRQVELLEHRARWVLIGGAAGGSKSHALRWIAYLRCLKTPGFRALILRRTFADLERTHMQAAEREAKLIGADAVLSKKIVRFPNGSVLEFGHCEDRAAVQNYLSAEYDLICPDEIVTFEQESILMIGSRARTTKPGVVPQILCGTNPGGPQSAWVRSFFIDHSVDLEAFPHYRPEDYAFIPSKLEDNPYLNEDYEQGLLALPAELRRAYRDGDWDIFPGQFFPEWRRVKHVTERHEDWSSDWPRYRAVDWGYVQPGWCGWFVVSPEGEAYLEQEYVFSRTVASDVAREIVKRTTGRVRYTVGDTSMWTPDSQTGEAISETFARLGVPMIQASKDRINGWARLRHWLRDSPLGRPWLRASPHCPYFARTIPSLVSDDTRPEDCDTAGDDHAGDGARYWAFSRPLPGRKGEGAVVRPGTFAWYKREGERGPVGGILAR